MFCPSCGANNSTEQKFCRSCGMNLEQTSQSILQQFPSAESANLVRRGKMLEKFGGFAFAGFGIVLLLAIGSMIYLIITRVIIGGKTPLEQFGGVLLVLFMVFAAMTLAYVGFNEDLKERKQKLAPTLENELSGKHDTAKLLDVREFEPVPSVIDETTELLGVKNKTHKL